MHFDFCVNCTATSLLLCCQAQACITLLPNWRQFESTLEKAHTHTYTHTPSTAQHNTPARQSPQTVCLHCHQTDPLCCPAPAAGAHPTGMSLKRAVCRSCLQHAHPVQQYRLRTDLGGCALILCILIHCQRSAAEQILLTACSSCAALPVEDRPFWVRVHSVYTETVN